MYLTPIVPLKSIGFPVSTSNIDGLESAFGSQIFSVTEQIESLPSYLRAIQAASYHITSFLQIK